MKRPSFEPEQETVLSLKPDRASVSAAAEGEASIFQRLISNGPPSLPPHVACLR